MNIQCTSRYVSAFCSRNCMVRHFATRAPTCNSVQLCSPTAGRPSSKRHDVSILRAPAPLGCTVIMHICTPSKRRRQHCPASCEPAFPSRLDEYRRHRVHSSTEPQAHSIAALHAITARFPSNGMYSLTPLTLRLPREVQESLDAYPCQRRNCKVHGRLDDCSRAIQMIEF